MGKKVEKAFSKDKNPSSASHDTGDDDPNKTPEPYKCTGNFQVDFTELCRRINLAVIPQVTLRPRPPQSSSAHDSKPDKGAKGKQSVPDHEPEPELNEDGEVVEPPPKTYTVKEKFEYFKPSVQVEMDHPDKGDTVTEIFIRGWKIDMPMMEIFQMCWPVMDKLHTVNLWQVGLTGDTLHLLSTFLPLCANLKNLVLDGNPVKDQNFYELLGEDSLIQNLSLRHCDVDDLGARGIGLSLGNIKGTNSKLLSLNLAGNRIGYEGVEHLARGLKMNRTLLSLSLASNDIDDKGAAKLAEALSRFPLSHEEVVERRRQLSDRGSPDRNKSPPPSRRAESKDRPGSVRSMGTHVDKDKKTRDKPSAKKKEAGKGKDAKEETKGGKKEKEDTRAGTKKASMADTKAAGAKTKGQKTAKGKPAQEAEVDVTEVINPLLEVADLLDGQLWVAGNRILINLNLSRNKIGETGISALLKAMQYQTTLTLDSRNNGAGLMRLCLDRNSVSPDSEVLKKLTDHMMPKDPFYKPPVSPDGETA